MKPASAACCSSRAQHPAWQVTDYLLPFHLQLKTAVLRVEQAALTGESVAVAKTSAPLDGEDVELQVGRG